jgi:transcriptional repressor NrdR
VKCPFCAHLDDKVIDSREGRTGDTIRRRRECLKCSRRFTTYERIDEIPYMVIKKDGRRERFERQKILQGLLKACEKRPVPTPKLEAIVDEIEGVVHEATERELTTTEIGEMIMHRLKKLDKVAYVRFASVYMDFKDVQEFMSELKNLLKDRAIKNKRHRTPHPLRLNSLLPQFFFLCTLLVNCANSFIFHRHYCRHQQLNVFHPQDRTGYDQPLVRPLRI